MRERCRSVIILCLMFMSLIFPIKVFAEDGLYTIPFYVDSEYKGLIRAYDASYFGNTYLSLTDLAALMNGTEKCFRFERIISSTDGEYFNIMRGQNPVLPSGASYYQEKARTEALNPYRNRLFVDGEDRKYYTHNPKNGDLFMCLADVQLMLDISLEYTDENIFLHSEVPFVPDLAKLVQDGYFDMMNSVLLGDADTGTILFSSHPEEQVPVASLTKLLSYLILKEGIESGRISSNDQVHISDKVQAMSLSPDGMITMQSGSLLPFSELMEGMLVASSNECALALAEHLCGTEPAFTEIMNSRAVEIGLNSVKMFNASGLPSYSSSNIPVKRQNMMSASDLFRLTRIIMDHFPEITDITSTKLSHLPELNDYWTANSNPLIYNMDGVTGLKTGSTNRAGYCLVATMPLVAQDGEHTIVLVLLGAETADIRGQAAEILLRYAKSYFSV